MISTLLDQQLCFAIYKTQKTFQKMYAKALAPYGLTYPQYLVLLALWEKGGQTMHDLGIALDLDSGTLTPMIKRMEQNGYVSRTRLKKDERSLFVDLTEKSRENKEGILKNVGSCLDQLSCSETQYFALLSQINALEKEIGGILHEKDLRNTD